MSIIGFNMHSHQGKLQTLSTNNTLTGKYPHNKMIITDYKHKQHWKVISSHTFWPCNYLFMLRLKLNQIRKRGHRRNKFLRLFLHSYERCQLCKLPEQQVKLCISYHGHHRLIKRLSSNYIVLDLASNIGGYLLKNNSYSFQSRYSHTSRHFMTRPVPLGFFINKFPLWDGAGLWPIKVSQACPTG